MKEEISREFELSTGYKFWITRIGKQKNYSLLLSIFPDDNNFHKIATFADDFSVKRFMNALGSKLT